jgi:short-subunit dehydrogenase
MVTEQRGSADHRPTFLVTGATSGVGEAIATQLGERGMRVLLGGRTTERGQAAADRIRSRVPDADLQVVAGDLSLMTEVRSVAYQVLDSPP